MKINGEDIIRLHTLGSWYDHGYVEGEARINGKIQYVRIHINEVSKMLNDFNFNIDLGDDDKRRKHIYLTVDASVYDDDCDVTEETRELLI